jgi:hypothetical protein
MKTIIAISFSLLLFGCSHSHSSHNEHSTSASHQAGNKSDSIIQETDHHHHEDADSIVLNHNEKWKVESAMLAHIRHMEQDINAFEATGPKDYNVLATKLKTNIDLLTSSCTMTGQAHDELHKWLLPYIDTVESLANSKSEKEAAEVLETIKHSFQTFNKYFN